MGLRGGSLITSRRSSLLQRRRFKRSQVQLSFTVGSAPIEDYARGRSKRILTLRRNKSSGGARYVGKRDQLVTGKVRYGIARTTLNRTDEPALFCCKIQVFWGNQFDSRHSQWMVTQKRGIVLSSKISSNGQVRKPSFTLIFDSLCVNFPVNLSM
jgi:hypothetical protein